MAMSEPNTALRHSLLIRIAGAMTIVMLVVLAGMGGAVIIAETARGNAAAINVAGSLRMQSYRIAMLASAARASTAPAADRLELEQAIAAFELALNSPELTNPDIAGPNSKSAALRQNIVLDWNRRIKPWLGPNPARPDDLHGLLQRTDAFVANVNLLVKQLERDTERRIGFLRTTISATLFVTLGVMLLTMAFLHKSLLLPLRGLLTFTTRIRRGDLAARTPHVGQDELGRLGHAFNLMAQDLAALYGSLEARVAEKTADLERSNRSLELLYHSIARLYSGSVEADTYKLLLREIEEVLELGPGATCLAEAEANGGVSILATTLKPDEGESAFCSLGSCAECLAGEGMRIRSLGDRQVLSMPLRDAERVHGVMQLMLPAGRELDPWKMRLLEALSRHIGTAIGTFRRAEHERVLSLLAERSVIARELHDSLAQSLSYMKIQVSRLAGVIGRDTNAEAKAVLGELREGLNSAYRQLRELLTTFRLQIEEESLAAVLDKTAQEFAQRGKIAIELETQLTNCKLSANEEIHILQIVREALSNVVHHARAQHAKILLCTEAEGRMRLAVEDDGVGLGNTAARTHHYGMAIMEERARGLGGALQILNRPQGGTQLEVRFVPASRRGVKLQQSA
jgi:two-component system nitrate/nitrite sensor histidine kinase NarX